MKMIRLEGSGWRSPEDFYSALLAQLGAPDWHGHNLDALEESLRDGDINQVGPPLKVIVEHASTDMSDFLSRVAAVFKEVRAATHAEIGFETI
jgi:RNAse (barnase) inhibitor barstar